VSEKLPHVCENTVGMLILIISTNRDKESKGLSILLNVLHSVFETMDVRKVIRGMWQYSSITLIWNISTNIDKESKVFRYFSMFYIQCLKQWMLEKLPEGCGNTV
jgi:hypothetical protein